MSNKITPKIKKIIKENALALAMLDLKSNPYVIGLAGCKVKENKLILTDNFMKSTVKYIKNNPSVALVVWDKKWKGYQFLGKANYYQKGKWLDFVKSLKENKGLPAKGAIVISVNKIIKSK